MELWSRSSSDGAAVEKKKVAPATTKVTFYKTLHSVRFDWENGSS